MKAANPGTVRRYRFVGDGAGVPGLPHEIDEGEAERSGVSDLLQAAIANGNYEEITEVSDGGNTSI